MAYDIFLKINNVKGESTDSKHKDEIELLKFDNTVSNPTTISSGTTGSGGGRATFSTFKVTKRTDKSTPILYQACASGEHYDSATVTARKAGKNALEYMIYTFTQVFVSSHNTHADKESGDNAPLETVEFSYGSVHIKYVAQKADGTGDSPIEGGWDLTQNQPK